MLREFLSVMTRQARLGSHWMQARKATVLFVWSNIRRVHHAARVTTSPFVEQRSIWSLVDTR
jgi:hypothetical protein